MSPEKVAEMLEQVRRSGADETTKSRMVEMLMLRDTIDASHERSNREARLEHARMGRSVPESRDGQIVWISPKEIFAQYGLDECGRPIQSPPPEPEYYL